MEESTGKRGTCTALLIVDMISDFEFEDGEALYKRALPTARRIVSIKERAGRAGAPVIYVNDNYGKWQEDFTHQIDRIVNKGSQGRTIAEMLRPTSKDYYVLKPQRSGFYETPLEVLLDGLHIGRLIITGVTTDICVLFTANDAHMRGFELAVPADCTAAVAAPHRRAALELLERAVHADISDSTKLRLE